MDRRRVPEDLGVWFSFLGKGDFLDALKLNTLKCFPEVVMIESSLAIAKPTKIKTWRCKEWRM